MQEYKTVENQKIVRGQQTLWTPLLTFSKDTLIAGAFYTLRAYANPNGKDVNSLDINVIRCDGCSFVGKEVFDIYYDFTESKAILSFDKSKISPTESSGSIVVEVLGNYNFHKMVKIPWSVDKLDLTLNENDVEITDISPKNTIDWVKGTEIEVLSFKVNCPRDVKENGNIWYRSTDCPKIYLDIDTNKGVSATNFIISEESIDFDKEYKIKYRCIGEINETKNFRFKLKLKTGSKVLKTSDQFCLEFKPKCEVYILDTNVSNGYVLGNDNSTLFKVTLKNEANIGGATAKLDAKLDCITHQELFRLDKSLVEIDPQSTAEIKLSLNGENLTQMPDANIDVEFRLIVANEYTKIKEYSTNKECTEYKETITLTI